MKYYKIENGQIKDVTFPKISEEKRIELNHIKVEYDGAVELADDGVNLIPATQKERTVFAKLEIRRAMRSLGIEEKLDDLLSQNETFRKDWQDAREIDLNDEITKKALESGGITENEIFKIREQM